MEKLTARIEDTAEGQVVVLPKGVTFDPSVKEVEVRRTGGTLTLSEPRYYPGGEEFARILLERGPPLPKGERLPVDIPERG